MRVPLDWAMSGQEKQILVSEGWVGGGGVGSQQSFIQVGSTAKSNPSPFYRPFYGEKVPFPVPSIDKWCPLSHTGFKILHSF